MCQKIVKVIKLKIRVTLIFTLAGFCLTAQEPLTLFQAIKLGLENNYTIQIQENSVEISENNNTIGNAGFLPSVDIIAGQNNAYNTGKQELSSGTEREFTGSRNTTLSAGVGLGWTLFDGFSMFINKDKLELYEAMSNTELRLIVENTVSAILLNYYGIVQQQKLIGVLRDAVDLSMTRKQLAKARISIGSGSKLMLLQSTVDLNADSTRLLQELAQLKNLKADLNQLLGITPDHQFLLTDSINLNSLLQYDDLKSKALVQNTTLELAKNNQAFSELNLKNSKSLRYPWLNFNTGYNYNSFSSETSYAKLNQSYGPSFGFTLSYNIFNGFNTNRQIKNAGIEVGTSEIFYKEADLNVQTDLYKLYNDYQSNLAVAKLEMVNQEVAKENVDIALEMYKIGSINDIELREIQKKYLEAQYQLLLSEFQAKLAEIELLRISGELYKSISK
jgi:outer membrane protein TolC